MNDPYNPSRREVLAAATAAPLASLAGCGAQDRDMTDVGSPFTQLQARILGSFNRMHVFGERASQQGVALYSSSGANALEFIDGVSISTDGTAGEWAAAAVGPRATEGVGLTVANIGWRLSNQLDQLTGDYEIGFVSRDPVDGVLTNNAAFRPDVGENTSGNVEVTTGGSVTQGQVDYASIQSDYLESTYIFTSVIIDHDAGETSFYFQQNPYFDPPNETVSAAPNEVTPIGVYLDDPDNSDDGLAISYAKVIYVF